MDLTVTFSKSALRDLEDIVKFTAKDNPGKAQEVGDKLVDKALGLNLFPKRHALCPNRTNVRKVPMSPFVIYYRVNESKERITILHFWHSSRQNPML